MCKERKKKEILINITLTIFGAASIMFETELCECGQREMNYFFSSHSNIEGTGEENISTKRRNKTNVSNSIQLFADQQRPQIDWNANILCKCH